MSVSPSTDSFLPTTAAEVAARGWEQPDVIFVSGDAYVDHPSFAAALLGRSLEAAGYTLAVSGKDHWGWNTTAGVVGGVRHVQHGAERDARVQSRRVVGQRIALVAAAVVAGTAAVVALRYTVM